MAPTHPLYLFRTQAACADPVQLPQTLTAALIPSFSALIGHLRAEAGIWLDQNLNRENMKLSLVFEIFGISLIGCQMS